METYTAEELMKINEIHAYLALEYFDKEGKSVLSLCHDQIQDIEKRLKVEMTEKGRGEFITLLT